jgi:CheY-like chemotaxis protein
MVAHDLAFNVGGECRVDIEVCCKGAGEGNPRSGKTFWTSIIISKGKDSQAIIRCEICSAIIELAVKGETDLGLRPVVSVIETNKHVDIEPYKNLGNTLGLPFLYHLVRKSVNHSRDRRHRVMSMRQESPSPAFLGNDGRPSSVTLGEESSVEAAPSPTKCRVTDGNVPEAVICLNDPALIDTLRIALDNHGIHAFSFMNKQRGLEFCLSHPPQIVISDLISHGIDGLEFLRIIRQERKTAKTRFFLVSGNIESANLLRAKLEGANGIFQTPCNHDDLAKFLAEGRPGGSFVLVEGNFVVSRELIPLLQVKPATWASGR